MGVTPALLERFASMGEQQITSIIGDQIARAYLMSGSAQRLAMDFNAELVTELREMMIWPARYRRRPPCD